MSHGLAENFPAAFRYRLRATRANKLKLRCLRNSVENMTWMRAHRGRLRLTDWTAQGMPAASRTAAQCNYGAQHRLTDYAGSALFEFRICAARMKSRENEKKSIKSIIPKPRDWNDIEDFFSFSLLIFKWHSFSFFNGRSRSFLSSRPAVVAKMDI